MYHHNDSYDKHGRLKLAHETRVEYVRLIEKTRAARCPKCKSTNTDAYSTRFRKCGGCNAIFFVPYKEWKESG